MKELYSLEQTLVERSLLEQKIFDAHGELTPLSESELAEIERDLPKKVDSVVLAYYRQQGEIERAKEMVKEFVAVKERQIERFKDVVKTILSREGKLTGVFSSVSLVSRKSRNITVTDFDRCAAAYPEAVTVTMRSDNERVVRISKTKLEEIYNALPEESRDDTVEINGFSVLSKDSSYPMFRLKGVKNGD
jgi:hypothetical protein